MYVVWSGLIRSMPPRVFRVTVLLMNLVFCPMHTPPLALLFTTLLTMATVPSEYMPPPQLTVPPRSPATLLKMVL